MAWSACSTPQGGWPCLFSGFLPRVGTANRQFWQSALFDLSIATKGVVMIAVTGAAGFIGSNLVHRLANQGYDLLLVDRTLSPAKSENLAGLPPHRFLWHDAFLAELQAGTVAPEVIFHLGACS